MVRISLALLELLIRLNETHAIGAELNEQLEHVLCLAVVQILFKLFLVVLNEKIIIERQHNTKTNVYN